MNVLKTISMVILAIVMVSCGNKTPDDVVLSVCDQLMSENYQDIVDGVSLEDFSELSAAEKELFVSTLTQLMEKSPKISSHEIISFPNKDDSQGWFRVKMTYQDGDTDTMRGYMKKDEKGVWKIDYLNNSVSDEFKNEKEFGKYIRIALMKVLAMRGIPKMQFEMGCLYMWMVDYRKDPDTALELIERLINLERNYEPEYDKFFTHIGIDKKQGLDLIKKAADADYTPAQSVLGRYYYHDNRYREALEYCKKAGEKDDARALFLIGSMFLLGGDITPNEYIAVSYLRRAAEAGCEDAAWVLGISN